MAKKKITKKIVKAKKQRKNSRKFKYRHEIKIEQLLFHNRQVFLSGVIDTESAHKINKNLLGLDIYSSRTPIVLWINSRGGNVYDGFSIIDCMNGLSSPVMTIINGEACSMGGIISIFGKERYMTRNSVWMSHDMGGGVYDYATKMIARCANMEKLQSKLFRMLRQQTKLTETDIEKAIHKELWLDAEECLKKGVIDKIVGV